MAKKYTHCTSCELAHFGVSYSYIRCAHWGNWAKCAQHLFVLSVQLPMNL